MGTTSSDQQPDELRPAGHEIEQTARELIDSHGHFFRRGDQFKFSYHDGVLEVSGIAHSFYLKQVLQTVLQELVGEQCRISNQVTVVSRNGSGHGSLKPGPGGKQAWRPPHTN